MLIGVVGWLFLGIIVGFIVSKVVPLRGDDPKPSIITAALAAVAGAGIYNMFDHIQVTPFNPHSLFYAALASVTVLVIWHGWRWKQAA